MSRQFSIKKCETCGDLFEKRPRDSQAQWADRAFCSIPCANDAKRDSPLHLRFWENVDRGDPGACWLWNGTRDERGYGHIGFRNMKLKAHRVSYEMRYGPIPNSFVICHACDTPECVNPMHLFAGTQKDNMQDASRKGRLNPKSLENLRPGAPEHHGAGPQKENDNGQP